jgi:hypothetical protein
VAGFLPSVLFLLHSDSHMTLTGSLYPPEHMMLSLFQELRVLDEENHGRRWRRVWTWEPGHHIP